MQAEEISRAFDAKVRRGMFAPVARHILRHPEPEDRLQDAICQTWEMYHRYAERGVVLDDAILVHSCRQRAVDLARHFVPADGQRYHDAFDQRAYREGKVEVLRLDGLPEDQDEERPQMQIGLALEMCASPEKKINSALDLDAWLDSLSAQDYSLLEGRMAGYELERLGHDLGWSGPTTCRRVKKLGQELATRAGVRIAPETRGRKKRQAA